MKGFLSLGLLFMLAAAGCVAPSSRVHRFYDGPERPPYEVATVLVPSEVEIVDVDESDFRLLDIFKFNEQHELQLLPGRHTLAGRYSVIFPVGEDDHETVRSPVREISVQLEAGGRYVVAVAVADTLSAAERVAERFQLKLVQTGHVVRTSTGLERERKKKPAASMPGATVDVEEAPARPVVSSSFSPTSEVIRALAPSMDFPPAVDPGSMLEFWWDKASEEERKVFLHHHLPSP